LNHPVQSHDTKRQLDWMHGRSRHIFDHPSLSVSLSFCPCQYMQISTRYSSMNTSRCYCPSRGSTSVSVIHLSARSIVQVGAVTWFGGIHQRPSKALAGVWRSGPDPAAPDPPLAPATTNLPAAPPSTPALRQPSPVDDKTRQLKTSLGLT